MLAERIGSSQLAELSAQGATLESGLGPRDLPRVRALVAPEAATTAGGLQARVAFRGGPQSRPVVAIEVHGALPLVCQRCLGPVPWPVDVDVALAVVPDESATRDLADPFDSVLLDGDGALHLRDAVEDEILAALPLAPLHAEARDCRAVPAGEDAGPVAQVHRPFAGLDALLGRRGPRDGQ